MTYQDKKLYFDHLDDKFEEFISDYDVERRKELIFKHLLSSVSFSKKQILEIGSGTGRFSKEIMDQSASLTILDIGYNLVSKVSIAMNCIGTVGDAVKLPFSDNTFDLIISSECIEHTLEPLQSIREMCRVCRSGGHICFTTPNRLWYPILILAKLLNIRKFSGYENWIFPFQAAIVLRRLKMKDIKMHGCHLLPFQLKMLRPLLRHIDNWGNYLYPLMINFGVTVRKP